DTSPTTLELTADIDAAGDELHVGCVVVLDLAGYELTVRNVVIDAGQQLTINDSAGGGTLTTNAPASSAGIQTTGATLNVNGGTVTADGGTLGAGIGGGDKESGGTVTITGGTVIAIGGTEAAGIGGGAQGAPGTITIT